MNATYINVNITTGDNIGTNVTGYEVFPVVRITVVEVGVAIFLSVFILAVIIGNMMVILSVALFREMRTLTNYLIVSLASADLLVAIIVLPISLHHEVMKTWTLGPIVCDLWISADVFCCTASILNIVVIAIDRYWLITKNVKYTHNTKFSRSKLCFIMIAIAWVISFVISISPLLGWRTGEEKEDPLTCMISQDIGYTVFSTVSAFYLPLGIILITYFKIFKVARKRARSRAKSRAVHPSTNSHVMTETNNTKSATTRNSRPSLSQLPTNNSTPSFRSRTRSSARTLGLIIGCFVFCWLPFFIIAVVMPFCKCELPPIVASISLWLGYSNSLLNPAIYAIWDKNFKRCFKRLLSCDVKLNYI